jgi:adenylate kinase family enzyme
MKELFFNEIETMIRESNIRSINICGSPGSGKTTLANKLSKVIGFDLYDLDSLFYHDNCIRNTINEDKVALDQILGKDKIIIDGTYTSTIEYRLGKIDLFIFTKSYQCTSLYRFLKRFISTKNLKCGERLTSKTLYLILNYKKIEQDLFKRITPNNKLIIYKER